MKAGVEGAGKPRRKFAQVKIRTSLQSQQINCYKLPFVSTQQDSGALLGLVGLTRAPKRTRRLYISFM